MENPDLSRWNARFDTHDYVFGTEPNAFLARHAAGLTPGRALCVADGEGRNGVWLAGRGWHVVSLDFSRVAQLKAATLADSRGLSMQMERGDVHRWDYPPAAFDLVVDIFTQFSTPEQRVGKWAGMIRSLKPGGTLILQGYTPDQIANGTGGPDKPAHLYTQPTLRAAFSDLTIETLIEEQVVLDEGPGHRGISAVIGLVARR